MTKRKTRKATSGRPTEFKPGYIVQAQKLAALGATDREVAEFFEVSERTIHRWKHTNEGFCHALKVGKEEVDARVEQSLYRRAIGYSHDAVKIFNPANAAEPVYAPYVEHVAPDTTACIFWLKNRRPDLWRDKTDVNHSGSLAIANLSESEIDTRLASLMANVPMMQTIKPETEH